MESIKSRHFLSNGLTIPVIGFGCYKAEGQDLIDSIHFAVKIGYRLIDSAAYYGNEDGVGKALAELKIPREELFVVSKIWPDKFLQPVAALDKTLGDLGLDYLDAYLLHWPGLNEKERLYAFEKLLEEQRKGKIKTLGISNFLVEHIVNIYDNFGLWPPINQIEIHPYCQQKEVCDFCVQKNIRIMSSIPLGRGKEFPSQTLNDIATVKNKSVPQIMLRWQIQKGYIPIPKSVHPERIAANVDIFDFSLSQQEMQAIDNMDMPEGQGRVSKNPLAFPE